MNKFKRVLITVLLMVFTAGISALAKTAQITAMEGDIQYVKSGSDEWQEASIGSELSNGDKLSSKDGAWAEISFKTGHTAKMGANSYMVINDIGKKTSMELFKGTLRSKVRKLSKKQAYEVKTPQSVCAVRGTEFAINVGESTQVIVYEGSVLAQEIATGVTVIVPAGKYTIVIKNTPPSEPDDIENLDQTQGGEGAGEGEEETAEEEGEEEEVAEEEGAEEEEDLRETFRDELRQEMREAVQDIRVEIVDARDVVEEQKQADAMTGRTLKDIHGNIVRVEQYILRPKPDTIQLINIAKRSKYNYKGRMGVGAGGARLDSFELKAKFNLAMPEQISDWFDFFTDVADHDDDNYFYPESIEIKTSNQVDSINVTTQWDAVEEEMTDPVVKLKSGKDGEWLVDTKSYDEEDCSLELTDAEEGAGVIWGSEDAFDSWMISPRMRIFQDTPGGTANIYDSGETSKLVRLGQEVWLFDDTGSILDADMFSEGFSGNPFDVIQSIAFENSLVCRYDIPAGSRLDLTDIDEDSLTDADYAGILNAFNGGTNFFSSNIDLVVTPDLLMDVAETIAKNADFSKIDFDSDDDEEDYSDNNFDYNDGGQYSY